ncbi:MAG: toll/interleukin-1 receptor domain-containing protein [Cyanobacteria bacterium P01_A01_bin.70]
MANRRQVALLKQGAEAWNQSREGNPNKQVDLSDADLSDADLSDAYLGGANLSNADLSGAYLGDAYLGDADLRGADLRGAKLYDADLSDADLRRIFLRGADLRGAYLRGANLSDANFSGATLGETVFVDVDLSRVKGLTNCRHDGPSIIDHRTLSRSGQLPTSFLRGVGLPDTFIDYIPSLFNQPIQFYSCFISYSHKDEAFAKRLHADLQDKGVRCWYAPENLPIGEKTRVGIDQAIRRHDKLLLILSEHSVNSQWVESEVESALEKERESNKLVLFPVRIDDTVMQNRDGWPRAVRNTRNIGNFCNWKDYDAYQQVFERLVRDLKTSLNKKGDEGRG